MQASAADGACPISRYSRRQTGGLRAPGPCLQAAVKFGWEHRQHIVQKVSCQDMLFEESPKAQGSRCIVNQPASLASCRSRVPADGFWYDLQVVVVEQNLGIVTFSGKKFSGNLFVLNLEAWDLRGLWSIESPTRTPVRNIPLAWTVLWSV